MTKPATKAKSRVPSATTRRVAPLAPPTDPSKRATLGVAGSPNVHPCALGAHRCFRAAGRH